MLFVMLAFSGCSEKECKPRIEYQTEYKEVPVYREVYVPLDVKCDIRKDYYTNTVNDMYKCIKRWEQTNEAAKGVTYE